MSRTNTKRQIDEVYRRHIPLVVKIGSEFASRNGMAVRPTVDEALDVWAMVATKWPTTYNPSRGSPSHWVYQKITFGLAELKRPPKRPSTFTDLASAWCATDDGTNAVLTFEHRPSWVRRLLRSLGSDAREVVAAVLSSPSDLMSDVMTSAATREAIEDHLSAQLDWDDERLVRAWDEVANAIDGAR